MLEAVRQEEKNVKNDVEIEKEKLQKACCFAAIKDSNTVYSSSSMDMRSADAFKS